MSPSRICYFDNNATTRVAPEVVQAMLPFLTEHWGNPSSAYGFGKRVTRHLDCAREQAAALIGAEPPEVVFTSCGTEGNNAAIASALAAQPGRRHVVTTAVEHSAVLKFCRSLQTQGVDITFLPVESDGSIDLHLLAEAIRDDTAIVSVMWANNETGVLLPVEEIAAICRSKGVLFHTDAVQVAGKLPIQVGALGVDFLVLSAHKFHAPKGVGLLYVRSQTRFHPYVVGGGQERGRRGGTENVAGIVALGCAASLAAGHLNEENGRVRHLRDRLEEGILRRIPGTSRNGSRDHRLPNTSNIAFEGVEAEAILLALDAIGVCASSGSACTTGSLEPSHVLRAMGLSAVHARGSIRLSLGIYNTAEEVDFVLEQLPGIVERLRGATPSGGASVG